MANRKPRKRVPRNKISREEEAYCQAFATNGGKGAEAVFDAFPHTRKWIPQRRAEKSAKLQTRDKIKTRLAALEQIVKQAADSDFVMSSAEILARLSAMGRANLKDYMRIGEEGQPTIAFGETSEAQFYALNEVSVEDIDTGPRKGKRTKIKMADRINAMKLIGMQVHGMFQTKGDTTLNGGRPIQIVLSQAEQKLLT
jgi:hypothetical protein